MSIKITNFINNNNSLLNALGVNRNNKSNSGAVGATSTYTNKSQSGSKTGNKMYQMRRGLTQTQADKDQSEKLGNAFLKPFENTKIDMFASSSYMDSLRNQRLSGQDAKLAVKKMRYNFKSLSSKIIKSKTSIAARQAAGQAKREIIRLKREAQAANAKGEKVDDEELQAEITHAKAMERVAKKKAKHLEEEEMARAKSGICMGSKIDDEELEEEIKREQEEWEEAYDRALNGAYEEDEYIDILSGGNSGIQEDILLTAQENLQGDAMWDGTISFDELGGITGANGLTEYASMVDYGTIEQIDFEALMMEYSQSDVEMEEFISNMDDLTSEMLNNMSEEMQELMEDIGLDEMLDAGRAAGGDMDPEDLKQMIIKHRNKEMKDMVKADSEYLKAIFKALADQKTNPTAPAGMSGGSGVAAGAQVINTTPAIKHTPVVNSTPVIPGVPHLGVSAEVTGSSTSGGLGNSTGGSINVIL